MRSLRTVTGLLCALLLPSLGSQSTAHIVSRDHDSARAPRPESQVALVAGRRDPRVIVVDLNEALDPANDGTDNAVVGRIRVTPDVDTDGDGTADSPASGLPSNVVVGSRGRTALVVNHAGNSTPADTNTFQHGHPGTIAILDLRTALQPAGTGATDPLTAVVPSGAFGPVGGAFIPGGGLALVAHSEGNGTEDGAREITAIDLRRGQVAHTLELALGDGGAIPNACPPETVPHMFPHPDVGCFADSNGIGITTRRGPFAFAANGGTDDVSVIDVERALAGDEDAEVARIPVERGPWGVAVSPDGRLVAVTNRESAETGEEGNEVSILDVRRAISGRTDAEVARVVVGTDDPAEASRPFHLAFTPDGRKIVVANFRTNNLSVIDVGMALAGAANAEVARIPLARPDAQPARPRGVALTPNGRFAVVTGGPAVAGLPLGGNGAFCDEVADPSACGTLWVVDLTTGSVVGTVTGVGNEPYLVDLASAR